MRVIFSSVLCFFLTACGAFSDGQYSNPQFGYWTGKNIHELTSNWGRPVRIDTAFNGNWEYWYYPRNAQTRAPMAETRTMTFAGPKNTTYGVNVPSASTQLPQPIPCVAIFQVNPNNVILSVRQEGQGCGSNVVWPGRT